VTRHDKKSNIFAGTVRPERILIRVNWGEVSYCGERLYFVTVAVSPTGRRGFTNQGWSGRYDQIHFIITFQLFLSLFFLLLGINFRVPLCGVFHPQHGQQQLDNSLKTMYIIDIQRLTHIKNISLS
jgi:hypothetical protein